MKKIFILITQISILSAAALLLYTCDATEPPPENPPGYQEEIPWPSLADSPWPMFHHDPQNTGRSKLAGPLGDVNLTKIPAYNLQAGIVAAEDSLIYYITSNPCSLIAVDFNGNKMLETYLGFSSSTTPLIKNDRTIYICEGNRLIAFDSDGSIYWEYSTSDEITTHSLTINKDGTIFLIDYSCTLYAITESGTLNWKITDDRIHSGPYHAPAISPDGVTLYIQGKSASLLAVNIPTQSIIWTFGTEPLIIGPIVDSQGNIYIFPGSANSADQTIFFSLLPNGKERWRVSIPFKHKEREMIPAISKNGDIYLGNDSLYCISYNGEIKWKLGFGNNGIYTSIIIDAENNIYFGMDNNEVVALNRSGIKIWSIQIENERSLIAPIIAGNGALFLSTFRSQNIIKIN